SEFSLQSPQSGISVKTSDTFYTFTAKASEQSGDDTTKLSRRHFPRQPHRTSPITSSSCTRRPRTRRHGAGVTLSRRERNRAKAPVFPLNTRDAGAPSISRLHVRRPIFSGRWRR